MLLTLACFQKSLRHLNAFYKINQYFPARAPSRCNKDQKDYNLHDILDKKDPLTVTAVNLSWTI